MKIMLSEEMSVNQLVDLWNDGIESGKLDTTDL